MMKSYRSGLLLIAACFAACGGNGPAEGKGESGDQTGSDERYGCIETRTKLGSLAASGLDEPEVQAILDAFQSTRAAELAWRDGTRTQVTGTFDNLQAFRVESEEDPDALQDLPRATCVDRVSVGADVALNTADGRLAERFEGLAFERDDTSEVWTSFPHKKVDDLMGRYQRQGTQAGEELTAVYFELSLSVDTFAGSVSEETRKGDALSQSASLANWPSAEP